MKQLLIMGDLNLPNIYLDTVDGYNTEREFRLVKLLFKYNLEQLNFHPSTDRNKNILEVIFSTAANLECYPCILESGHYLLDINLNFNRFVGNEGERTVLNWKKKLM